MTQDKEWSCGICTFLNKPLFLSCEMCGQDRPSQRPSPPQRQRSMDPSEFDTMEREEPRRCNRMDRAPRSVQRHASSAQVDLGGGVMGTLIMTDDPSDYESMDGKKEEEEEEEEVPEEEDPAMEERRYSDTGRRRSEAAPRRAPRNLPARRHTFDQDHQQAPPRQSYMDRMNSSYNRLNGSMSNFDDSFSGSLRSSRRHPALSPRAPQRTRDIHIVGQSNGLPVISVCGGHSSMQRQGSSRVLMSDCSSQSQFSGDSSSRGPRSSLVNQGSARRFESHVLHHHHQPTPPPARTMGPRGSSFASLQQQQPQPLRNSITHTDDYLPSLEPPPVPELDNPADVDPRSVFANDQEHSNRRKSANELRRDRSAMLEAVAPSVRNLRCTPVPVVEEEPQFQTHPALLQDTEALDSPRTRKERKKLQRKKLKGAVKGLMATMRLASVTN